MKTLDHLPTEIIVVADHSGNAEGNIIYDNQDELNPALTGKYTEISLKFNMANKELSVTTKGSYANKSSCEKFSKLTIMAAKSLSDIKEACLYTETSGKILITGRYDSTKEILTFYKMTDIYWRNITKIEFGPKCNN